MIGAVIALWCAGHASPLAPAPRVQAWPGVAVVGFRADAGQSLGANGFPPAEVARIIAEVSPSQAPSAAQDAQSGPRAAPPANIKAPSQTPPARVSVEPGANEKSAANNPIAQEITPQLDASVARGLARLAQMQNADGSFGEPQFGRSVAVTSLACIAFMADGNVPGRGAYGEVVAKGLEYVLRSSTESGLLATDTTSSPMYGHGFATLFLGEVYGMTQGGGDTDLSDRVHRALLRAIRLIEGTQNQEGGWRYNPVPFDADTSVTICQIMGLRSARNAGLEVSKDVIDKAVEYVRACQNPDGGFRYQGQAGPSAWPRSAAGIASLQYAGMYDDPGIKQGIEYLFRQHLPRPIDPQQIHYFYGEYYAVQACYLAGGEAWATWWPKVRQEVLSQQQRDGSWEDSSVGTDYGTAMALIVLQMPKRYLPIFQK